MASLIAPFRILLNKIHSELNRGNLESLINMCGDFISGGQRENIKSGWELFNILSHQNKIGEEPKQLKFLLTIIRELRPTRKDLVSLVERHIRKHCEKPETVLDDRESSWDGRFTTPRPSTAVLVDDPYAIRCGCINCNCFSAADNVEVFQCMMTEAGHVLSPQADFTAGPDCYQKCLDWVEECELFLNGPLAAKSKAVKANYVLIWAGKIGRAHIKTLDLLPEEKRDPSVLLEKFLHWTKPKSNALAAAANFHRLKQGDLSLAEYIDKATFLCDQCEYPPAARDRLLRDAIVNGLRSKEAYDKCIARGSALTLEEVITISQSQNATANQVGYMRPEFKSDPTQVREVHKPETKDKTRLHKVKKGKQQPQKSFTGDKQRKSGRDSCFNCGAKPSHPRSKCPAKKAKCLKCGKEGHFGSVCRSKNKDARVNEVQV